MVAPLPVNFGESERPARLDEFVNVFALDTSGGDHAILASKLDNPASEEPGASQFNDQSANEILRHHDRVLAIGSHLAPLISSQLTSPGSKKTPRISQRIPSRPAASPIGWLNSGDMDWRGTAFNSVRKNI